MMTRRRSTTESRTALNPSRTLGRIGVAIADICFHSVARMHANALSATSPVTPTVPISSPTSAACQWRLRTSSCAIGATSTELVVASRSANLDNRRSLPTHRNMRALYLRLQKLRWNSWELTWSGRESANQSCRRRWLITRIVDNRLRAPRATCLLPNNVRRSQATLHRQPLVQDDQLAAGSLSHNHSLLSHHSRRYPPLDPCLADMMLPLDPTATRTRYTIDLHLCMSHHQ